MKGKDQRFLYNYQLNKKMDNKKKVMIVEDDSVLANALELSLRDEGYEISLATDGEEAEKMIQKVLPDLVLLDLLLPIKNGFEVLKVMRQNPETKDISVIILTNFEQETSIDEGMKLGAKDYIVKANIDIKDIPNIVKKYIWRDFFLEISIKIFLDCARKREIIPVQFP